MLASEMVRDLCCGQGLPLDCQKLQLAKKVEALENEVFFLNNQLENAIKEIKRLSK